MIFKHKHVSTLVKREVKDCESACLNFDGRDFLGSTSRTRLNNKLRYSLKFVDRRLHAVVGINFTQPKV